MYFCGGGDDTAGPAPAFATEEEADAAGGGVEATGAAGLAGAEEAAEDPTFER